MRSGSVICAAVLSALVWHSAFVFPESCGVVGGIMLGYMLRFVWDLPTMRHALWWGMLTGGVFFSLNLWWLFALLWTRGHGSGVLCVALYIIPVFVYAFCWAGCMMLIWFATRNAGRMRALFGTVGIFALYTVSFERWGGYILGARLSYPLAHPGLPIVHHLATWHQKPELNVELVPVRPQAPTIESLYHALSTLEKASSKVPRVLMTPERAVAEVLVQESARMAACYALLPPSTLLCVGALSRSDTGVQQACYLYNAQGLVATCHKRRLVPFYEYLPWGEQVPALRQLFLREADPFVAAVDEGFENNFMWKGHRVVPRICADFFLVPDTSVPGDVLCILVNDAALEPYVAALLRRIAAWRALRGGYRCLYVGWRNSLKI